MANDSMAADSAVQPGSRIGMVGGGQLGRMFAIAAAEMGYVVRVFCEAPGQPAAQVAAEVVTGPLDDLDCVRRFAEGCDVITLEFENIPADTIAACESFAPTYPSASVLATAQDRLLEKSTLREAGLPVTPFVEVADAKEVDAFAAHHGYPVIVKTARSGYDGKGQHRLENVAEAGDVPWSDADRWICEKCIDFDREVSVVVARTPDGRTATFPLFENDHVDHVLDVTSCPASVSETLRRRATDTGVRVAEAIDLVGLVCVELFVRGDEVMINEIAPRPHNSGHVTIEACATDQFEQHVRAICNQPLGDTRLVAGAGVMANLLGDLWHDGQPPDWSRLLSHPGVRLHLYGKGDAKPGRKMGHLTLVSSNVEAARHAIRQARESIAGQPCKASSP